MTTFKKYLLAPCILFLLASTAVFSQNRQDLSLYPASDPNISISGRVLQNDAGNIEFDWPGIIISANFKGETCAVKMDDTHRNYYDIFIDDTFHKTISVSSDTIITLADHLTNESHTLRIIKRTEGNQGKATFKGLLIDGDLLPAPKKGDRKIEFIGNSITCGYGSESEKITDRFKPETENCNKSFASITGRTFSAEYHIIAHSGMGVVRNYGDKNQVSEYTMPDRYTQLFDNQKEPLWDFSQWKPDMLVINLGTNDFSTKPHPNETVFKRDYTKLIKYVRSKYDTIPVFCIVGPMTDEPCYSYVKKMVEGNRNFQNDDQVYFIGIPPYLMEEQDWGAYHPKYSGQIKMAEHIVPVISAVMGWDYGKIE